jgi:hypothetical protein
MKEGEWSARVSEVCRRRWCGVNGGTSGGKMEGLICQVVKV